MMTNDSCTACPMKCHYTLHFNNSYKEVEETYYEEVTNQQILDDLNKEDSNVKSNKDALLLLYNQLLGLESDSLKIVSELKKNANDLTIVGMCKNYLSSKE